MRIQYLDRVHPATRDSPPLAQPVPVPRASDDELALWGILRTFSITSPLGLKGSTRAVRDTGWVANNKSIHPLWREGVVRVLYRRFKHPREESASPLLVAPVKLPLRVRELVAVRRLDQKCTGLLAELDGPRFLQAVQNPA